jgi:hypothetical protein
MSECHAVDWDRGKLRAGAPTAQSATPRWAGKRQCPRLPTRSIGLKKQCPRLPTLFIGTIRPGAPPAQSHGHSCVIAVPIHTPALPMPLLRHLGQARTLFLLKKKQGRSLEEANDMMKELGGHESIDDSMIEGE